MSPYLSNRARRVLLLLPPFTNRLRRLSASPMTRPVPASREMKSRFRFLRMSTRPDCTDLTVSDDASKKEKAVPRAFPAPRKTTIKYVPEGKNLTNLEEGRSNKHITVERLPIDKFALVGVNNIASNGAAQSNHLMGFVTGKSVLEHTSSSHALGDNLVQHCELGIQHSGTSLDEQNLNNDVEQAILDVFGSPSNIDNSSFVVNVVGDMEQYANLFGSIAQDSVDQNVNCNHAMALDNSDEEVVQCTPVHGAQQHCIQDSVHAANNVASTCDVNIPSRYCSE